MSGQQMALRFVAGARTDARYLSPKGKALLAHAIAAARGHGLTCSEIGRRYDIAPSTAQSYASRDMSPKGQAARHAESGRSCTLPEQEEAEVLRLAKDQRAAHRVIDNAWTRTAFANVTQQRVPNASSSTITRFWQRHGWPTHRLQARTPGELRDTLQAEADEFQQTATTYVHDHEIPPANVHVADETGLWNGSVALRSRVDPDTMDTGGLRQGDNARDTGMVALSAAGTVDSYFLQHQRQVTRKRDGQSVVTQKRVAGMGTQEMLEWSKGFAERHQADGESVLILDRLGSHRNKQVHGVLEEGGVKTFLLPPQASKLISPCENTFFSSFKARMRRTGT
jgi:transposase